MGTAFHHTLHGALMPLVNTDGPLYAIDQPVFLRTQKKAAFEVFVRMCNSQMEMPEEQFADLWQLRWQTFASGVHDESIIMLDILAAHRLGFSVDVQAVYELWLAALQRTQQEKRGS